MWNYGELKMLEAVTHTEKKGKCMPRIKILPDSRDLSKPKEVPNGTNLNATVPRFRPPGGKPPLSIEKSYNRQGEK